MIEPIEGKGVSRANAVCDDCGRREAVHCDYRRAPGNKTMPDAAQVKKKITAHGWSDIKGKLRCPTCETKRKIAPMPATKPAETVAPQMSKRDRINIISMLAEVYDLDAGRYKANDTDETVAEVLETRPGWVAEVREAEFGPAGGNENIDALEQELSASRKVMEALLDRHESLLSDIRTARDQVTGLQEQLARIKKAVGPRVMQRAKG